MTTDPFGALASLRRRPIPDQRAMRELKQGYREHSIAPATPDERLIEAQNKGLRGENFYASHRNPPHYRPITGSISGLWLREGVVERLRQVNRRLRGAGLALWLFDGWRPTSVQSYFHDRWMPDRLRSFRPDLDEESIRKEVEAYWAAPTIELTAPSPHLTGGAVDLSLCWADTSELLWMGSLFDDISEVSHLDRYEKVSPGPAAISDSEAQANRRLLYWVMIEAGFSANPTEWWHFSFGDQMWARLTGAPAALYGATMPVSEGGTRAAAE